MQKFYFNLFLQEEEVANRYLNIRSFDKAAKDYCDEFSKSIFFGAGVEDFYSNKSFLLLNNILKKKMKKNNCQYIYHCPCFNRNKISY